MNVVLIVLDSLNRHFLSCYGNSWIQTPNLQRLANRATVFDNHFISSAPCMPARREIFSGRREFLWRGWGQAEPFDRLLPDEARDAGARTALITDHYHYWDRSNGYGFAPAFGYLNMIRGQEGDSWGRPVDKSFEELPEEFRAVAKYRPPASAFTMYRNMGHFQTEDDFFSPQVMQSASDWLDANAKLGKFFLMVESFDPHEPWYIPEPYRSMYGPYDPSVTCWPPYQRAAASRHFAANATPHEIDHIRRQYAGKVTMVDRHLAKVLDTMDRLHLWDNTVVVLTTDHGHEMAERDRFGKSYPHWNTNAHIPLIIWDPRHPGNGVRSSSFSCTADIYATVLDALGGDPTVAPDGLSQLPAVADNQVRVRDHVLYGTFRQGACLATERYTYFSGFDNTMPIHWYSTQLPGRNTRQLAGVEIESGRFIPGVEMPVWKVPVQAYLVDTPQSKPEQLFRFDEDHQQKHDIISSDPRGRALCRDLMRADMADGRAPAEQFSRLGLDRP